MKGHHTARRDGDFLAGFRIAARTLRLVAQLKISEAGELDAITSFQGVADFFEEGLDPVFGLTLVEANLFEQQVGKFGFGQCHRGLFRQARS